MDKKIKTLKQKIGSHKTQNLCICESTVIEDYKMAQIRTDYWYLKNKPKIYGFSLTLINLLGDCTEFNNPETVEKLKQLCDLYLEQAKKLNWNGKEQV